MPKIKTLKSASKRFKKTSSGQFKRKRANLRHILTKKNKNYKRHMKLHTIVSKNDFKKVKLFLPYL
ncbi:50S ribosomal protein L35 [Buchnera aphidicola (Nipponaphis monzeni)]|uniref:Large ribosomal subunit protein bL35 n=1 Tax=Buchnera aphidicola (Nipponaphis monzeni) TaxID=2495405 RepID=A0A455T9V7_9GAMM|nr:50S ribosomal protein L35 [Buchnera aphidicola]BBI01116.1 50S ribosomal protein L35 [Buchnera aphidicola (Nipponaphis monzeni)]